MLSVVTPIYLMLKPEVICNKFSSEAYMEMLTIQNVQNVKAKETNKRRSDQDTRFVLALDHMVYNLAY